MKQYKLSLALLLGLGMFVSCGEKLELVNPNQQTTQTFGFNAEDLEESVIAAYNHIRMEGSYARVGYTSMFVEVMRHGMHRKFGIFHSMI